MAGLTKLERASQKALKEYLGLSPDETLLVISDSGKQEIGLALFEQGKKLCREAIYAEMKMREINGEEPPDSIAELMKLVDVVICPTSKSITHTNAKRNASAEGVRVATMPGITLDTLVRCLSADPEEIVALTAKVSARMRNVSDVRVTTKLGTDITLPIKKRRIISSTGVLRKIGEGGNLPSGEVYVAPWEKKSNGIIVFDGSISGIGIVENPITVEVKNGYATKIKGGEQAQLLKQILEAPGRDGKAVAEFGIGTNHKAKICGDILEDEKVLGTIHIAFGNNISMGGKISVHSHIDGIIKKPTVYFDGEAVMTEGKLLIE